MPSNEELEYQEYLASLKKPLDKNSIERARVLGDPKADAVGPSGEHMFSDPTDFIAAVVDPTNLAVGALSPFVKATARPVSEGASKLASYLGGKLTAAATGAKGLSSAAEQSLMREGLVGTRGMLEGQVQRGLKSAGEQLGDAASQISGGFPTKPIADAVIKSGSKLEIAPGAPTNSVRSAWQKVQDRAADIAQRGSESGTPGVQSAQGLQAGKVIAGNEGWATNAVERTGVESAAARAENQATGDVLTKAFAEQHPGMPNAYGNANARYGALSSAKLGLQKETNPIKMLLQGGKGLVADPLLSVGGQASRLASYLGKTSAASNTEAAAAQNLGQSALESLKVPSEDDKEYKEYLDFLASQGKH